MPRPDPSRTGKTFPVDPDSLLATHVERHINLYLDIGMCIACVLVVCCTYAAADVLLSRLL
ncbi:hypothetical protein LMG28688_06912 [Paraburkholderia caffeinitolerans]|uniref:Uncharacterized protein n=1 Tax=Paraburkholderia caffeinitolerans TaxID=1723730 RepID=A0A6J5H1H6_9BURK|nr:hypothetical protein [Paraburkholderia caffeinitolerans]CAB3809025.1 hypothetical protein LMG28688_06912 [Paraburkholderia caffeinitolerans]